MDQLSFLPSPPTDELRSKASSFLLQTIDFEEMGSKTLVHDVSLEPSKQTRTLPCCTNEFWTAKQRQANRIHEISYRACFKPQLPAFFITRLTRPGDVVFDPFMGRGTTPIEAALLGRIPAGSDVNPLSLMITRPRLAPPTQKDVEARLHEITFDAATSCPEELLAFYHPDTLAELCALRQWLIEREEKGTLEPVDEWIRMVAINRLTGHSNGFFSVYTLPPNQAASVENQLRINATRNQIPPYRNVRDIIARKSKILLSQMKGELQKTLASVQKQAKLYNERAGDLKSVKSDSVHLIVTSPPFVDIVNYDRDNWLRCWFAGIDMNKIKITQMGNLKSWSVFMQKALAEMLRIVKPGGHIAVEVGEVRKKSIRLEEVILPLGIEVGLTPVLIMINEQNFTKTAQLWGVDNNTKGTNSNRIVLFRKD